ncbi:hypothetical protein ACI79J_19010 [Geodermatophilus sp. SYSU D01062]
MDAPGTAWDRLRPVRVLPVLAVLLAALLGGCGGGSDDTTPPAATSPATPSPSGPSPGPSPTDEPPDDGPPDGGTPDGGTPDGEEPDDGSTPAPGTAIPGEDLTAEQAAELQAQVDGGHQPWRTDVAAVAAAFAASELGWDDAEVALADPHTTEVTDPASGHVVTLQLRQPAREGEGGIWVVVSGVWVA